jgi:hypothetical protein
MRLSELTWRVTTDASRLRKESVVRAKAKSSGAKKKSLTVAFVHDGLHCHKIAIKERRKLLCWGSRNMADLYTGYIRYLDGVFVVGVMRLALQAHFLAWPDHSSDEYQSPLQQRCICGNRTHL